MLRETPTSIAIFLVLNGLGALFFSANMLARGFADGSTPVDTQRFLELAVLAALGLVGSVSIGVGLMLQRLVKRRSILPKVTAYASLVTSLLTFFLPGLALSCYLVYQVQQLLVEAERESQEAEVEGQTVE